MPKNQRHGGYLLIVTLVMGIAVFTVLAGVLQLGMYNLGAAKRSQQALSARYAAEAGADRFMYEINQNQNYTGTNTTCPLGSSGSNPTTLYSDSSGRATYENCVVSGSIAHEKIVYVLGKVYEPASATVPRAVKQLRLVIEGTPAGSYSVQTGPGGLVLTNSASITSGNVYVGGYLSMSNTAQIGTSTSPVAVSVANQRCPSPPDATFPALCPSGQQPNPITISNQAQINGSVKANGQTNTAGMSNPGLVSSSGVAGVTLPNYDRASQVAAVTSSMTSAAASCSGNQTRILPANVHITGDVTISNNCIVTVNGNAWIDGKLSLTNNGQIKIKDGLTSAPTIMIDGSSGISLGNRGTIAANAGGVGAQFITFYSTATCSPGCSSVTGTDLANSMNITTVSLGNQGLGAGSSFYARWTGVNVGNGGATSAILGQKIIMSNSANITFGGGTFDSGLYSWDVRYYESL